MTSLLLAETKVVSLHPVLTDIAEKVGGKHIKVIDLIGSQSVHGFNPTARDLRAGAGAKLYLAAGKGLEPYLGKLRNTLGSKAKVYEVGKKIISLKIEDDYAHHCAHCSSRSKGNTIDPHWWNSINNLKRATNLISKELAKIDPTNAKQFKKNASNFRRELDLLNVWVKKELATIPQSKKHLATAHAAFAYFCKEYKFKALPIQGINKEQSVDAKHISEAIKTIKKHQIAAIFPEIDNNPKALSTIAKATGVKIGKPLIADGIDDIDKMFRQNVKAIVNGLR